MALHNDLGQLGEDIACQMLKDEAYTILERNWRYLRAEIDIIAKKEEVLVFIEVKSRSNIRFGEPDAFLSKAQELRLFDAANAYIDESNHESEHRFDVISVLFNEKNQASVKHFKDAFLSE